MKTFRARRFWWLLPLLALSGLLVYLAASPAPGRTKRTNPAEEAPARVLTITGQGRVQVEPDRAWVRVGVYTEADRAQNAVEENSRISHAVMKAIAGQGVAQEDIRTGRYQVFPREERDRDGVVVRRSFAVEHEIVVTVKELDRVGRILDAALDAGANRVYGVAFGLSHPQRALEQARIQAIEDARRQAEALAQAAGVKILSIQSINVSGSPVSPPRTYVAKAEAMAADAGVPIAPGTLEVTATVTIVFEIR